MAKRRPKPKPKRRPLRPRIPTGRHLLRWLALGIFVFVGVLYYQPLRSYYRTRAALEERAAEVEALRQERGALQRRLEEADTPEALEREARRLGYIRPGERLFIVKGIDAWRRERARSTP